MRFGKVKKIVAFAVRYFHWILLLGIVSVAIWLRMATANFGVLLDYDPWWFYRHAQEILTNGFLPPRWDILSYCPPGRPVDYYLGWSYTLAIFYSITKAFANIDLMRFSGLFVAVFSGMAAVPAYFVGRSVTNRWGGLFTALFTAITPTFIGVSLAGYPDSDSVDVFYTMLAVVTTLYAIKKSSVLSFENLRAFAKSFSKYFLHMVPALISFWLFATNWNSSWYIYFIFLFFIPLFIIFKVVESFVFRGQRMNLIHLAINKIRENKGPIVAIILLGLVSEMITYSTWQWPFNTIPPHEQLIEGLNTIRVSFLVDVLFVIALALIGGIVGVAVGRSMTTVIGIILGLILALTILSLGVTGKVLLVDISVAELQNLDVFSASGFLAVVGRIGWMPITFALLSFVMIGAKLVFKKDIHFAEYFAVIWFIISLVLITHGIRFSLLFSMAVATAAGFFIGNAVEFVKKIGYGTVHDAVSSPVYLAVFATLFAVLSFAALLHISDNITFSQQTGGLEVDSNWQQALAWLKNNTEQNSLVATWWDPGHIITGYTGLKVFADGAHCAASCVPYNLNTRIRDMGKILSTTNEQESVSLLQKYTQLTDVQKQVVIQSFGSTVPNDAFTPVPAVYVIASSDLIGKYYWLSYFGSYNDQTQTGQGANFIQFQLSSRDQQNNLVYSGPGDTTVTVGGTQSNEVAAVLNSPSQGIRNTIVSDVVIFGQNGQALQFNFSNATNLVNGMVWVSPDFQFLFFMPPNVRDSTFTKMFFFNGQGLQHFEPVFVNAEVKIFKVKF